jgi:hypothetical protein
VLRKPIPELGKFISLHRNGFSDVRIRKYEVRKFKHELSFPEDEFIFGKSDIRLTEPENRNAKTDVRNQNPELRKWFPVLMKSKNELIF